MEASFTAVREGVRSEAEDAPSTSEEEIEALVADAIHRSRGSARTSSRLKASRR